MSHQHDTMDDVDDEEFFNLTMSCLMSPTLLNKIKTSPQQSNNDLDLLCHKEAIQSYITSMLNNEYDNIPSHIKQLFQDFVNACVIHFKKIKKYEELNANMADSDNNTPIPIGQSIDQFFGTLPPPTPKNHLETI